MHTDTISQLCMDMNINSSQPPTENSIVKEDVTIDDKGQLVLNDLNSNISNYSHNSN